MSFDDCPSQAEARWREDFAADQARYWEDKRLEVEQREEAESEAAAEAHWRGAFASFPDHLKRLHWPERTTDPRLHGRDAAIADGEIPDAVISLPPFDAGSPAA